MEKIPANAATKAYNNGIKSAHLAHFRTLRNTGLYFVRLKADHAEKWFKLMKN